MKYIIDINKDKPFTDGQNNKLYRANGFTSLVFDEYGLEKLEPYKGLAKKNTMRRLKKVMQPALLI